MSDGPKLHNYKPKKAHLKKHSRKEHQASSPTPSSSSTISSSSSTFPGTSGAAPPPLQPKESFARRYKFLWPLLLAVNFTAGAYLFMRTKKSNVDEKGEVPSVPSALEHPGSRISVHPDAQRELFKWLLEERKKMKPKDAADKKRIQDEVDVLKFFLEEKSPPKL